MRTPPSVVSSTLFSGSREMSINREGRSTSSFIKSIKLVPPAMNFAVGSPAICRTASATSLGPCVLEIDHDLSIACSIAATMFGYAPQRQMLPLISSRISSAVFALPSAMSPTAEQICPGVQ